MGAGRQTAQFVREEVERRAPGVHQVHVAAGQLDEKERFGQVNGAYQLVINGLTPLGGLVADRFGLRAPLFLAAGLLLACTLVAVPLLPRRALDDLPEPDAGTGAADAGEG